MIRKIISGGQTGADQAALDVAIKLGIPHGGWIPKGRMTEDGPLPEKYNLEEMPTKSYPARTEKNILDSDGTLIITHGRLAGGSALTKKLARKNSRPCLHVNLNKAPVFLAASKIHPWILENGIEILNVAGSRASKDPEIYKDTSYIIEGVLLLSVMKAHAGAHITDFDNDEYLSKLPVPPKTVNASVDRLISELDLRAKVLIANMDLNQLFDQHSNLFIYFKNSFEVWPGNKELIESCRAIAKKPVRDENDATVVLLGVLWKRLQESHKLKAVK